MKYLLAALGGFALTSLTFAGGVAIAILYLSAEPAESGGGANYASLEFPSEAVKVDVASQSYERIGELPAATAPIVPRRNVDADTDSMATAALSEIEGGETLSDEHVAWCSARYRSYQVDDNSYQPYRGGRRECVSPYYDANDVVSDDGAYQEASLQQGASADLTSEFVAACMSRYRSYRVEDNTYQPYGGGARVQCQ
ncbi:MAG: BA14K family protein [Phyllobacteriaceae bacterium]|nr:BA14K family protein [Phyllobacteriaceae bacterium]